MSRYSIRPRLKGFSYTGRHRYFITICTHRKYQAFTNDVVVATCLEALKEKSSAMEFNVWAYCFMPDHLHIVLEGDAENADLNKFISLFKQISGYRYRQHVGQRFRSDEMPKLWQSSFYDHVLREDEDILDVVRYTLNNPVRKGLARHYSEYLHSGSLVIENGMRGIL